MLNSLRKGDDGMYRIGEFSKMSKTTIKTLRYYDEVGLLTPSFVDEENGYRYYTTEQLIPLHQITALRQVGLSIDEVISVLSGKNMEYILKGRRAEIESEIRDASRQLSRINCILSRNKEDFFMDYQAIVKELPEYIVYYKSGVVPSFADLGRFIPQAQDECRAANPGIKYVEPDYCYVTYTDPEFKHTDVAVEYAEAVAAMGKETETIKFKKLDSVPAVCVYHKGPYEKLGEAYAFAFNWVERNGYTPSERPRERYIDGMWNKENPEDWLTEIQIPVIKK